MKSVKFVVMFAAAMLLLMFATACGGRDGHSDLLESNEQLQVEIERLLSESAFFMNKIVSLQEELDLLHTQANGATSQPAIVEIYDEFPMFHQDLQSLLNEPITTEFTLEHAAWQNLASASEGMEYILWRGSLSNLSETERYINLLVQNGWELVTMFGAGSGYGMAGMVIVMRR